MLPDLPKNSGDQALGRSRGGLTTKIHAAGIDENHSAALQFSCNNFNDAPAFDALYESLDPIMSSRPLRWTRDTTRTVYAKDFSSMELSQSFLPDQTGAANIDMTPNVINEEIPSKGFSTNLNTSDASLHATINSEHHSSPQSISSPHSSA